MTLARRAIQRRDNAAPPGLPHWQHMLSEAQEIEASKISQKLSDAGIIPFGDERAFKVYIRHLRGKRIYDGRRTSELRRLCKERGVSLKGFPEVYPGSMENPWVEESARRVKVRLIEGLEKKDRQEPSKGWTLRELAVRRPGIMKKIYQFCMLEFNNTLAFARTPPITRAFRNALHVGRPIFFQDRTFLFEILFDWTAGDSWEGCFQKMNLAAPPEPMIHGITQRLMIMDPPYLASVRKLEMRPIEAWGQSVGSWFVDLDAHVMKTGEVGSDQEGNDNTVEKKDGTPQASTEPKAEKDNKASKRPPKHVVFVRNPEFRPLQTPLALKTIESGIKLNTKKITTKLEKAVDGIVKRDGKLQPGDADAKVLLNSFRILWS